jgi:transposase
MFLKTTVSRGHKYLQIVESYKQDGISKHKVVSNLGRADVLINSGLENIVAALHKLVKKEKSNLRDITTLKEKARLNYGYIVFKKLWNKYSLTELLTSITDKKKTKYNFEEIVFPLVINRLLSPSSKRYHYLHRQRYIQTDKVSELHQIYRALDVLASSKEKIEEEIFNKNRNLFNMQIDVIFYDVTTFHFESQRADELRDFGFSKANKINEVQVVMGLLIDNEGRPIGYELFPGNTFEGKTMLRVLKKLKDKFKINQVIIVADKGLNSKMNFKEIKSNGFDYIVSSRIKNMGVAMQEKILSNQGYVDIGKNKTQGTKEEEENKEVFRYKVIDYENKVTYKDEETGKTKKIILKEKLVCTYSSKRAAKDYRDRQRSIEKAKEVLEEKDYGKLTNKKGYKKYINTKGKQATEYSLDETKIKKDSRFDGYYAIAYSRLDLIPEEVIEQYHNLYRIEESFRILKSTMKTRPIYLRTKAHIEGHFVICFFAFLLERELELRLRKRKVEYSSEKIKEALNSLEFSEIEIEKEKYYLKGKQIDLASKILSVFKIRQPSKLMTNEQVIEYLSL